MALEDTLRELEANLDRLLKGKPRARNFVLSESEIRVWLQEEPTFPKPIAYPTGVNRDDDPTTSYQNQFPLCLNE